MNHQVIINNLLFEREPKCLGADNSVLLFVVSLEILFLRPQPRVCMKFFRVDGKQVHTTTFSRISLFNSLILLVEVGLRAQNAL